MIDTVSGAPDNFKVLKTFLAKIAEIVSTRFWTAGCRVEQLTTAESFWPAPRHFSDSDCVQLRLGRFWRFLKVWLHFALNYLAHLIRYQTWLPDDNWPIQPCLVENAVWKVFPYQPTTYFVFKSPNCQVVKAPYSLSKQATMLNHLFIDDLLGRNRCTCTYIRTVNI